MINYQDYVSLKSSGHVKLLRKDGLFFLEIAQANPITGEPADPILREIDSKRILQQIIFNIQEKMESDKKVVEGIRVIIADEEAIEAEEKLLAEAAAKKIAKSKAV